MNLPGDFLELAVAAMQHLKSCGRANVLYNFAKAIGTMREDKSDSLLPAKRMPMGLIEHCVNFFTSTHVQVFLCIHVCARTREPGFEAMCMCDIVCMCVSAVSFTLPSVFVLLYCLPAYKPWELINNYFLAHCFHGYIFSTCLL